MLERMPSKWKLQTLGEIAEVNPRDTFISLPENTEVSFVPMAAVSEITASITRAETRRLRDVRKGFTPFREGDILFAKITPCMENGKVAIAHHLVNGIGFGSTEFHVIRPFSSTFTRLICYFLRKQSTREYAALNMIGSAGQQRVPRDFLNGLKIPLPSTPEEQEHVADLLDEVDAAYQLCAEISQELDKLIYAFFIKMFGNPEKNPRGWDVVPLSRLVQQPESGWSPQCLDRPASDEEFGVIKLSAITSGHFLPQENKALPSHLSPRLNLLLNKGDLLFSRANTRALIGATAIVEKKYERLLLADKTWRLHSKPGTNACFLKALLSTSFTRQQISNLASGTSSSMLNISKDRLLSIIVFNPPSYLQDDFAQFYWLISEAREYSQQKHRELEQLFSSLLSSIFGESWTESSMDTAISNPFSTDVSTKRTIWSRLSITQRKLWGASQTFTEPFKVDDLSKEIQSVYGTSPNREYLWNSLDLLDALGVTLKEGNNDLDRWRRPDPENDPEISI